MAIPKRPFGRHADVQVSALALGGHHVGDAKDEETASQIMNRALDAGVNFFDNCWEYHRGMTEGWMGKIVKKRRSEVFLMTKVCTHGRDKQLAMRMLDQSLRRLQTDHLDLWQAHGMSFYNDPELFIRPGGAAEALAQAKKDGKVRFVGFTGHRDPEIHLAMLKTGFPFDAVQMPLNAFDGTFRSFETQVLPELNRRGIAALGMKPMNGGGNAILAGELSAAESLRYAMSLPVTTTITGMDKLEVLEQNLKIADGFQPMSQAEMQALRDRLKRRAADGRYELYKVSVKYDNPESRMAHDFPIDLMQKEVYEMIHQTEAMGDPYMKAPPPPEP